MVCSDLSGPEAGGQAFLELLSKVDLTGLFRTPVKGIQCCNLKENFRTNCAWPGCLENPNSE